MKIDVKVAAHVVALAVSAFWVAVGSFNVENGDIQRQVPSGLDLALLVIAIVGAYTLPVEVASVRGTVRGGGHDEIVVLKPHWRWRRRGIGRGVVYRV